MPFYLQLSLQCHLKTVSGQLIEGPLLSGFLENKSLPGKAGSSGFPSCSEVAPGWRVMPSTVNVKVSVGIDSITLQEVITLKMYDEYH